MNPLNLQDILNAVRNYSGPKNGQFSQDVYALAVNNFKREGYFVEFGALNGVQDSNTYVLEKNYGWTGLLCEPGKGFQETLKNSRNCSIDYRAVYSKSNETLMFKEMRDYTGLSGLEDYNYEDMHAELRRHGAGSTYPVTSVTLNDLLSEHNAPAIIDYMSIDTEGSEPVILDTFDFSKHQIRFLTIEHNHNTINKYRVRERLLANGYVIVFEELSGIDDYFMFTGL